MISAPFGIGKAALRDVPVVLLLYCLTQSPINYGNSFQVGLPYTLQFGTSIPSKWRFQFFKAPSEGKITVFCFAGRAMCACPRLF